MKKDGILDQRILNDYCNFVGISVKEFWRIADKWYNPKLFKQDRYGVWEKQFSIK